MGTVFCKMLTRAACVVHMPPKGEPEDQRGFDKDASEKS